MEVIAKDTIYDLLDQIDKWAEQKLDTVEISLTDLLLLKECYLEELEENETLAFENMQMAKYLSKSGLTQQQIDDICNG